MDCVCVVYTPVGCQIDTCVWSCLNKHQFTGHLRRQCCNWLSFLFFLLFLFFYILMTRILTPFEKNVAIWLPPWSFQSIKSKARKKKKDVGEDWPMARSFGIVRYLETRNKGRFLPIKPWREREKDLTSATYPNIWKTKDQRSAMSEEGRRCNRLLQKTFSVIVLQVAGVGYVLTVGCKFMRWYWVNSLEWTACGSERTGQVVFLCFSPTIREKCMPRSNLNF